MTIESKVHDLSLAILILREEVTDKDLRVYVYNVLSRALAAMIADLSTDPVLAIQLLPADQVVPNDYNPNRVASAERKLLRLSIEADGVTMPVVASPGEGGEYAVVDGFHRRLVLTEDFRRKYIPCSIIAKPQGDRMASTVRHNRARGKHQVDLMGELVKKLIAEGWEDVRIAEHLGMTVEELLRLKQITGAAALLANEDYSLSWGARDEADLPDD